jgi:hypothetical protein
MGFHPAVYFYSITGRYQITSFLAVLALIKDFEKWDFFEKFTSIREKFEDFIIKYKIFVNQTTTKYGSGLKGYKQLKKLYFEVIGKLLHNVEEIEIIKALSLHDDYKYLNPNDSEIPKTNRQDFPSDVKSAIFLTELLKSSIKCNLCRGYLDPKSSNIDHTDRKEDGGKGNFENGKMAHPFCNALKG